MFAKIIDGKVSGISTAVPALAPDEMALFVPCGDEVAQSWIYSGGALVPPPVPTEEELFNQKMAALEVEYSEKLSAVASAVVVAIANDGDQLEANLARLRADYQRIRAARIAAIEALWAQE